MLLAAVAVLKLLTLPLLAKVAWVDLNEQRIANRDVLALLCLGAATLFLSWADIGSAWNAVTSALAGLALFCVLIPFWLGGKVGGGDVKLMAVAPLISGGADLLPFAVLLLLAALATVFLVSRPMLLPEGLFRRYVQFMDRKRMVPFGVPIAASLSAVLLLQLWAIVIG